MQLPLRLSGTGYIRVQLGITQQQLADSLGISRSTLALAETGRRPMPESAAPMLWEMLQIAKKMPAPGDIDARYLKTWNKPAKRSNNRVGSMSRLRTFTKKPFVTAQISRSTTYVAPAMTRYNLRTIDSPGFSTFLLQDQAECQELINQLSPKQNRMCGQLEYLQLEARMAVTTGKELQGALLCVNTMLQCNSQLIEQSPSTPMARIREHRNAKLYCKKLVLEDRLAHFDAGAMLLREYNINVMLKQLALLETLINTVEKRNAEWAEIKNFNAAVQEPIITSTENRRDDEEQLAATGNEAAVMYLAA